MCTKKRGAAATPPRRQEIQTSCERSDSSPPPTAVNGPQRVYRMCDLPAVTGLQRSMIEQLVRQKKFPKPITLHDGGKAVGWLGDEIVAWQEQRRRARDAGVLSNGGG